ncbi:TonB-dependent receptor [Pseudomonas paraeruginosa]|uniref:TonB-dependent receptor domain-containing protein n=1 Tax=Pseudomonas paraeruginosa TaxID=2994495 RepID=UPI003D2B470D
MPEERRGDRLRPRLPRWHRALAATGTPGAGRAEPDPRLDYDQSRDDRRGYQNFNGDQLGVKGGLRRDEVDTATSLDPYLQASWAIDAWTLQAGVRHSTMKMEVDDHYLSNGDASGSRRYRKNTPSFSVMYAFTPDLHGYLSAGKGFETPTQAEMAYAPVAANSPDVFNFGLKPATSSQYEAGLKARLWGNTRVNAAIFQIRTEDEIVVASSLGGRTSYQNAGKTLRRGFELGLESELGEHWNANLAYTRLSATYDSLSRPAARPSAKASTCRACRKAACSANWYGSPRRASAWAGRHVPQQVYVEDSNSEKAAPSYAVFNWRTRFEQRLGAWTFHQLVRLDNLFDRQYVGSVIVGDGNRRYYEAAPGLSWYAGAGVEYQF